MSFRHVLALDAGTTGIRAILFDERMRAVRTAYRELAVAFPRPGWVEQDAREIRDGCLAVLRDAAAGAEPESIETLGITNQRETVVVWDPKTGEPVAPAIVWQDRRTADRCHELRGRGLDASIRETTGLAVDPYFSATKLQWLKNAGVWRSGAIAGTVDSWVLWNLTGGERHATDLSNASRTMLCDIRSGSWDPDLCALFDVAPAVLPEILDTDGDFGTTAPGILAARVPIRAMVGDQQGALFGQRCFSRGAAKATFGTGLFVVGNAGSERPRSDALLATVAWRLGGRIVYALEGSAFTAGAAVQWLRDGLGILATAGESEDLARSVADNGGVYFVPALSGLGAPQWDAGARGLFIGLTRGTSRAHVVRAVLEAIDYQARELVELLEAALGAPLAELAVDGGATANGFLMEWLAAALGVPVRRSALADLTAAGAAGIAGIASGLWAGPEVFAALFPPGGTFAPAPSRRDAEFARWKEAVARSLRWA